jgi:hypothetical protein
MREGDESPRYDWPRDLGEGPGEARDRDAEEAEDKAAGGTRPDPREERHLEPDEEPAASLWDRFEEVRDAVKALREDAYREGQIGLSKVIKSAELRLFSNNAADAVDDENEDRRSVDQLRERVRELEESK